MITVHDGPYWLFQIEDFNGKPIVHLSAKRLCPKAIREAHRIWDGYRQEHPEDHYALQSSPGDPELFRKFAQRFGWKPTGLFVPLLNSTMRELFIHKWEDQSSTPTKNEKNATESANADITQKTKIKSVSMPGSGGLKTGNM